MRVVVEMGWFMPREGGKGCSPPATHRHIPANATTPRNTPPPNSQNIPAP